MIGTVAPERFMGWRMVAISFVVLNCALGISVTAYGSLIGAIQREFHTSLALATGGLSMITLSLGLLSPVVGGLVRRVSLKRMMICGVLLNAAGFALLTQVDQIGWLLAIYGLMIGPGFCLFSIIPCTTIVSNWFVQGRGRALGLINMPIGNAVMPVVAAYGLDKFGLHFVFWGSAALLLLLVPLILRIVDRPELVAQQARGAESELNPDSSMPPPLPAKAILLSIPFLVITLGVATLSGGGMMLVAHLVALGTEHGLSLGMASLLLAAYGLAGIAGAPVYGWLADRIGVGHAFAVLAFAQVLPWLSFIFVGNSMIELTIIALLIGMGMNAVIALFGTLVGEWLGQANVSLAMGLSLLLQIPFMFGAGPLAGAMHDATGNYTASIMLHIASFITIGLLFAVYRPPTPGIQPQAGRRPKLREA